MLQQPLIDKLLALRLPAMADALKTQEQDPATKELSFLERLGMLVDQQWTWRENQALGRRLKGAKLRGSVCVEDIDYRAARGLDKSVIRALTQESVWVHRTVGVTLFGPRRNSTWTKHFSKLLARRHCFQLLLQLHLEILQSQ